MLNVQAVTQALASVLSAILGTMLLVALVASATISILNVYLVLQLEYAPRVILGSMKTVTLAVLVAAFMLNVTGAIRVLVTVLRVIAHTT